METNYKGIEAVRDLPGQVEFNRRKNVEQDQRLSTLSTQVTGLLAQEPAGYLPEVYYGIVPGEQTYRFAVDYEFEVESLNGTVGDSYELYDSGQSNAYIPAIAVQTDETTLKIIIKGDYPAYGATLTAVNMKTGDDYEVTLAGAMTQQTASYLGALDADDYKNKQITVLHDLQSNKDNVLFCSIDLNSDEDYNWISIGSFTNGADGKCVYSINNTNKNTILSLLKAGDSLVICENMTIESDSWLLGDVLTADTINPLTLTKIGNIKGPQGATGATGATGASGADGETPEIVGGYWYIGGVSTGVKAEGVDGANGQDGKSFETQSGLYSAPDNEGQTGNVDPDGNALLTLPTLPSASVEGKAYVVFDPLTTPLQPYYDMYWASGTDTEWTIIHPFNGINGTNGTDGQTPYIGANGHWYTGSTDTGVNAEGPTGATGATGPTGPGVPSGGTQGQILVKSSSTNYDTAWADKDKLLSVATVLDNDSTDPVILYNLQPGVYLMKGGCYYLLSESDSSARALDTGAGIVATATNQYVLFQVSSKAGITNKIFYTFYGGRISNKYIYPNYPGTTNYISEGSLSSTSTSWGDVNELNLEIAVTRYTDTVGESGKGAGYALTTTNTTAFTPTADYHPATKKYVDDHAGGGGSTLYSHAIRVVNGNSKACFTLISTRSTAYTATDLYTEIDNRHYWGTYDTALPAAGYIYYNSTYSPAFTFGVSSGNFYISGIIGYKQSGIGSCFGGVSFASSTATVYDDVYQIG